MDSICSGSQTAADLNAGLTPKIDGDNTSYTLALANDKRAAVAARIALGSAAATLTAGAVITARMFVSDGTNTLLADEKAAVVAAAPLNEGVIIGLGPVIVEDAEIVSLSIKSDQAGDNSEVVACKLFNVNSVNVDSISYGTPPSMAEIGQECADNVLATPANLLATDANGKVGLDDTALANVNSQVDTAISDAGLASSASVAAVSAAIVILDALIDAIKAQTDQLCFTDNLYVHAHTKQTDVESEIAAAIRDTVMDTDLENDITLQGAVKLMLAILTGKSSGGGGGSSVLNFRDLQDTKNRLSVTVDSHGNRIDIGTRDAS